MTKFSALAAMAFFYLGGCESVPPEASNNSNNTFTVANNVDMDGDGVVEGGVPGGDVTLVIRQTCETAPNEGTEELCFSTLSGALRGTGDCDGYPNDDPAVCFDGGLDCSQTKYSVCALCIHPAGVGINAATEVCDGVDNDCDAQVDEGLICITSCDDGDACTFDGTPTVNGCPEKTAVPGCCHYDETSDTDDNECPATHECVENNTCAPVTCQPTNACFTAAVVNHDCVQTAKPVDDANACTTDACNTATGAITHTALATIDDSNACTVDACNTATGAVTHTPVAIDDMNSCTTDACNTTSGAITHTKILGCAAQCNVEHDNDGEATSDCAPYRDPQLSNLYGWGCWPTTITTDPNNMGTCVAYEDQDNDEFVDVPERFCADGIDGDLDGKTDGADSDCPVCTNVDQCDDGDPCTTDSCSANLCVWTVIAGCIECQTNAQCPLGKTCGEDNTCHTTTPPTTCSPSNPCPSGYYCADGVAQCFVFADQRGNTSSYESGLDSKPDTTPDNFDNDGDGFCETAPCVGSLDPRLTVSGLQGGDCDDNPAGPGTFVISWTDAGGVSRSFTTDGSYNNRPGAIDWADNYDNACKGHPFL